MAAIVRRKFAGMAPSANQKELDGSMSSFAQNVNLRFGDFRPLLVPADMGIPMTPGQTLYRMENSGYFITNPNPVSFVRGPIPNDTIEKTYYTGDAYPKVMDSLGGVRRLGVPQPAVPVSCLVNVVDEFSEEDALASQPLKLAEVNAIVWDKLNQEYVGLTDSELAALGFVATSDPWRFRFVVAGTKAGDVFTPTNDAHRSLMDDKLGFYTETVGGTTTGYVDVFLRGFQYQFDPALGTALQTVTDPSDPLKFIISSEQAGKIGEALADHFKPAHANRDISVPKLKALATEFAQTANAMTAATSAASGAVGDFYERPSVDSILQDGLNDAVKAVFDAMQTYNLGTP